MAHFEEKSSDTESNDRHWYFTSLMEEVILALQPRLQCGKFSENPSAESAFEDLENRFATLEVEEPSEEYTESTKFGPQTFRLVYELEPPADYNVAEEERKFAVLCMLGDLWQLRRFVGSL
jgi:hypothetical protein